MSGPRASPAPSPAALRRAKGPKPQSRPTRLFTTNSTGSSRQRLDSLTPGPTAPLRPPTHTCPNPSCTGPNKVVQEDDGSYVCHHCGTIASEHSHIVSEIQFGETASGAPAVQGQYIGADQTHARSGAGGRRPGHGPGGGDGMNSKQLTELNARREMNQLVSNLRDKSVAVAQRYVDPAVGLFKLALQHNFVQGRSISTVAAVALYLQCRRSKDTNEVMLIDIAECINVNVFVLGKMYTKMIQILYGTTNHTAALKDKIDTINPENLIRRFAKGLDFPGLQVRNMVVNDAIRLVQRMDRDWMATGRRPAGICGAALILAARMNNFRRTVREVVLVVKVTEITINKRLEEFSYTDSSNLTVEEFRGFTLERACDPPSFYKARQEKTPKRGKKRKGAPETAAEIEEDESEDSEEAPRKRRRIDSDGFAIPDIPIDPALRRSTLPSTVPANGTDEEPSELSTPPGSSTSEQEIDEALTQAVNSAISEMQTEQQASSIPFQTATPDTSDSSQKESERSSSESVPGDQPKRRYQGRPKGAKNWQPPPATTAELALEAEIEGEVLAVLESGAMQAPKSRLTPNDLAFSSARLTSEISQGPPAHTSALRPPSPHELSSEHRSPPFNSLVTAPPVNARANLATTNPFKPSAPNAQIDKAAVRMPSNSPNVEDTSLMYLDDDPEVSTCMLSQEERDIKERIWVAENADWLRKDHVKKIKAELQAAADREAGIDPDDPSRGKGRGRKKKRGRLGDVSYLDKGDKDSGGQGGADDGDEGGHARSAREATMKMMAHRGYSRRVNYDVFKSLFPEEEEAARQRSSRSSTSTNVDERRPGSGARATASGSGSPASTPVAEKDAAGAAATTTTTIPPSSSTTPASPSVTSPTESAVPSESKPKPKPKPRAQTRKAVSAFAVPIAEPGKPLPAPSGPSRPTKPLISPSYTSSATTRGYGSGRAPGGQKGFEEREARRQARAATDAFLAKEWDAEIEDEEEVLNEAEREERSWMERAPPKDGPALAIAKAAEGRTRGTAVRLPTPMSRAESLVGQQPQHTPTTTTLQTQPQIPEPARVTSPPLQPPVPLDLGEEEILGSIDTSPLTSLRSSVVAGGEGDNDDDDDDGDGDGEGDADDYVEVDDDEDLEAAFAGRFARRKESFGDDDDEEDED